MIEPMFLFQQDELMGMHAALLQPRGISVSTRRMWESMPHCCNHVVEHGTSILTADRAYLDAPFTMHHVCRIRVWAVPSGLVLQ